jgi:hypothetical protein
LCQARREVARPPSSACIARKSTPVIPATGADSTTVASRNAGGPPRRPASASGWGARRTKTTSAGRRPASGCGGGGRPIPATGATRSLRAEMRYKNPASRKSLITRSLPFPWRALRYKRPGSRNPLCLWGLSRLSPAMRYKRTSLRAPAGSWIAAGTSCA